MLLALINQSFINMSNAVSFNRLTHDSEVTCVQVFAGLAPWNIAEVNKILS